MCRPRAATRIGSHPRLCRGPARCSRRQLKWHAAAVIWDGMPLDLPRADGAPDPVDAEPSRDPDNALLDAYSETVTRAVARVAPAVAHVRVERAKP